MEHLDKSLEILNEIADSFEKNDNNIQEAIEPKYQILIRSLSHSIVAGEYVDAPQFQELLFTIKEAQRSLDSNLYDARFENISTVILPIIELLNTSADLFSYEHSSLYNSNNIFTISVPKNHFLFESIDILKIALQLALIDHYLHYSQDQIHTLVEIYNNLKTNENNTDLSSKLKSVLRQKCSFLLFKLQIRAEDSEEVTHLVGIGNKFRLLSEYDFKGLDNSSWNELAERFPNQKHYFPKKSLIKQLKNKERTSLSYTEIYYLIKHYKNDTKSSDEIKNFILDFQNRDFNKSSSFDKYSHILAGLFFRNNALSLLLENVRSSKNSILEYSSEVIQFQKDNKIENFYSHYRILDFLIKDAESKLDSQILLQPSEFDDIQTWILNYEKSLSICSKRNYIQFRLPFNESIKTIGNMNVFFASGFSVPINYIQKFKELANFKSKIDELRTRNKILKDLQSSKQELQQIRDEQKGSQKKSIEILSIFAAIVLFSSGTINFFKGSDFSVQEAVAFIMAFGHSLVLFVATIFFVLSDSNTKYTKDKMIFFGFFAFITICLWIFLLSDVFRIDSQFIFFL